MSLATLAQARHQELKRLWILACQFEQIEHTTQFVQFSPKNKYAAKYNQMVGLFFKSVKESTIQ